MLVIVSLIFVVLVCVGVWIRLSNGIVRLDNRCDAAWATLEAQLQRRYDLVPNLVECVKGYAGHESSVLRGVVAARTRVGASTTDERAQAEGELGQALGRLVAVAEAYPDLKADGNFLELQRELGDTEDKISYARMSYNDCVLDFDNAIETFPGSVIARGRFRERHGFEVTSDDVRQAPEVRF